MNKEELRKYLLNVARAGYADPSGESRWIKEEDGSTTIKHHDGPWSMHDNFFGGEPYGGREIIMFEGKPVWIMVYYGEVSKGESNVGNVYKFLQKALSSPDEVRPLRGPSELIDNNMRYQTKVDGDILKFNGYETITRDGSEIYSANYMGGLVDQRGE